MNLRTAGVLAWLCWELAACTPIAPRPDVADPRESGADSQLLVMVRSPPQHFRPDAAYVPAYDPRRSGASATVADAVARRHGLEVVDAWPMPALGVDCFVMRAPDPATFDGLVRAVARDPGVESAQPMHVFHVLGHNDPLYPLQPSARAWHLAELHRIATGRDVLVAEIDTGVDRRQPDLRERVELARDFTGTAMAPEQHGTAVAGIIAARADDGIGIAGIAPDARLQVLRACRETADHAQATCTSFALARALQFALDQRVQVLNLSLGGPRDRLLERLLDVALAQHVVVVAAVDEEREGSSFPASHPGVLAVATGEGRHMPPADALIAPGRDVPTTLPGAHWGLVDGSSYAAAHVSGAAALLLERTPGLAAAGIADALRPARIAGLGPRASVVDVCSALARTTNACVCECVLARAPGHEARR